jgi:hypothetical protein
MCILQQAVTRGSGVFFLARSRLLTVVGNNIELRLDDH